MARKVFILNMVATDGEDFKQLRVYGSVEAAYNDVRANIIKVIEDDRQDYESWLGDEVDSRDNYLEYLEDTIGDLDEEMKAWLPSQSSSATTASTTIPKKKKRSFVWHGLRYTLVAVPYIG